MKHFEFFSTLYNDLAFNFYLYTWRDGLELLILAAIIYKFLHWLAKDPGKQPVLFFMGYAALTSFTYYAGLSVVSTLLVIATPIVIVLAIIMHQHTLQKNVIAHKNIHTSNDLFVDWLDELMRAFLSALNKHKEIMCVIERDDSLQDFLKAPYYLNADLKKSVLEMLFDQHNVSILWVHKTGKIVAINSSMKMSPDTDWLTNEVKQLPGWKQDAIFLTHKTDAIVIRSFSNTRMFECIIAGNVIQDLTASHTISFIKRVFEKQSPKDEYFYVKHNRTFTEHQRP
jgi:DNA integrity scanning protein DisA with diadenylate cyclase activity